MNRRYRRQMTLRSRAHRRGEPIGCRCHRRKVTVELPGDVTVTICEPSWKPLPASRKTVTLADISDYEEAKC